MGAVYEREFKGILSGDERLLLEVGKTLNMDEKRAYETTVERPFLVVRAAGSLGADLVAIRENIAFLVEVKSSKEATLYLPARNRLGEQFETIRRQCEKTGVLPVYAYRQKGVRGDAWRLFTLGGMAFRGFAHLLYGMLPPVAATAAQNRVLRWDAGYPLAKFLGRIEHSTSNGTVVALRASELAQRA